MHPAHNITEFSVSEFSRNVKRIIEDAFGYIKIRGEITGFKRSANGHIYFSLKDEEALISAVCFRNMADLISFEAGNGMEVVASGRITTYEGRSSYQIIVEKLEIAGIGALMEAIEKRRQKLLAEGLFDAIHKKPLPFLCSSIGIITSPQGAVIEDIIHRITARFPTNLLIYPVSVQGKNAAREVIQGIKYFHRQSGSKRPDLIIIARGGGSFEDLLPFQDEDLVREIFKAEIPIISAIGHETDTSLTDYVADLRAPTPTAAAELATPLLENLQNLIENLDKRLTSYLTNALNSRESNLNNSVKYLTHPKQLIERLESGLAQMQERLKAALFLAVNSQDKRVKAANLINPTSRIELLNQKLNFAVQNFYNNRENNFKNFQNKVILADKLLSSYHYKKVLERGYAMVRDKNNNLIGSSKNIKNNQQLVIEMSDGNIDAFAVKK
jgi:exodeoxyribonuclease VII large subunit